MAGCRGYIFTQTKREPEKLVQQGLGTLADVHVSVEVSQDAGSSFAESAGDLGSMSSSVPVPVDIHSRLQHDLRCRAGINHVAFHISSQR
jgi:hypothetical protein